MDRINRFVFAIIQFLVIIDSTQQSKIRQGSMALKVIDNTIRKPFIKTIGNTIKKSMNTVKTNRNFGLGINKDQVHKINNKAPWMAKDGFNLVRTEGKKNIQMKSAEYMGVKAKEFKSFINIPSKFMKGKELKSIVDMVSRGKGMIPLLVGGGAVGLTQMNLVSSQSDKDADLADLKEAYDNKGFTEMEKVITSDHDKREYVLGKLDNEMPVLLISDKDTQKSSASIMMGVGSYDEPREFLGLSHFLEHMLFLGSKKYPTPSFHETFFAKHGGSNNAYTADHRTVYAFDVSNAGFVEALDRTSHFFKTPLFDAKYTEKEINAVDSEYIGYKQDDMWRKFAVLSSISDPKSFTNRFTIGSKETLNKPGIRDALLDFHSKYYSSNLGFACLYNNQPISTMKKYAVSMLSDIPNNNSVAPDYKTAQKPYGINQLKKITKMEKLEDGQDMSMLFSLPAYDPKLDSSLKYISSVITHKNEGSIFSELFKKGWLLDIGAGHGLMGKNNSITYYIELCLSKDGMKKYDQVASAVAGYLEMLRTTPTQKWFHDELKEIHSKEFDYLKKDQPFATTMGIAGSYGAHQNENLVNHNHHFSEFNPIRIKEQLGYMTFDNSLILLAEPKMKFEKDDYKTDEYFKVKYQTYDYDEKLEALMTKDFYKPEKPYAYPPFNEYLAKNYDLQSDTDPKLKGVDNVDPDLILSEKGADIWYKPDVAWKQPKALSFFHIYNNDNSKSMTPEESVYSNLWIELLRNHLKEETTLAQMAGCSLVLTSTEGGMDVRMGCFNDSMLPFMDKISQKIKSFKDEFNEKNFNTFKTNAEEELNQWFFINPVYQAKHYLENILNTKYQLNDSKLQAQKDVTFEGYKKYCQTSIWSKLFFQGFFAGNITEGKSIEVYHKLKSSFDYYKNFEPLERKDIIKFPILNLAKKETGIFRKYLKNDKDENSAILKHYQLDPTKGDLETRTKETQNLRLIKHFLNDRFFSELRTEQQLGYMVHTFETKKRGHTGITFSVRGYVQDPNYVSERITEFTQNHQKILEEQTMEEFEQLKSGYIETVTKKPLNLPEEAGNLFNGQIYSQLYNWDYIEKRKEIVSKLTKDDAVNLYKKLFLDDQKVIEVHMVSANMKENYIETSLNRTYKNLNIHLNSDDVASVYDDKYAYREDHDSSKTANDI